MVVSDKLAFQNSLTGSGSHVAIVRGSSGRESERSAGMGVYLTDAYQASWIEIESEIIGSTASDRQNSISPVVPGKVIRLDLIRWALFCELQNDSHFDGVFEFGSGPSATIRPEGNNIKGQESLLLEVKIGMA